jgi:imidazole glycerol-phosphate synthase subunit HisH
MGAPFLGRRTEGKETVISIVNYGSGNIQAICNIYGRLGIAFVVASKPEEVDRGERIVLPGVGAFDQAMNELDRSGLRVALDECALKKHRPILGICVGMQLLAKSSEEGVRPGLGWIDGIVRRFDCAKFQQATRLPHMGWNTVEPVRPDALFKDVDLQSGFYFLHSYYFSCEKGEDELGRTNYGGLYTSVVNRGNIYGVQFHPEKSHQAGIQLLKNFAQHG